MSKIVYVTEDDLYAAIEELHNTGTVDWTADDGSIVTLSDAHRCQYCNRPQNDASSLEAHLQFCEPMM